LAKKTKKWIKLQQKLYLECPKVETEKSNKPKPQSGFIEDFLYWWQK
jgi:hypothetical protein